jgi:multiple sugar transport system substrate-binding protein
MIPKGSAHPEEAFEFIRFLSSQEGMEMLCLGHRKFSPLKQVSEEFNAMHPHPYIGIFRELAFSPNGFTSSKTGIWNEYRREMGTAVSRIQNLNNTPEQALRIVQERISGAEARNRRMIARRESMR